MITPEEYDTLAQYNHVLFGALVVILSAFIFSQDMKVTLVTAGAFLIYAAIKEFIYDNNYEPPLIRGSSLKDFILYTIGVASGLIIVCVDFAVKFGKL